MTGYTFRTPRVRVRFFRYPDPFSSTLNLFAPVAADGAHYLVMLFLNSNNPALNSPPSPHWNCPPLCTSDPAMPQRCRTRSHTRSRHTRSCLRLLLYPSRPTPFLRPQRLLHRQMPPLHLHHLPGPLTGPSFPLALPVHPLTHLPR